MLFSVQGKDLDVPCQGGDSVKVYRVPKEYSDDLLYVAVWRHGEIEPVPACKGSEVTLLAHVKVFDEEDGLAASGYMAEGVSHA